MRASPSSLFLIDPSPLFAELLARGLEKNGEFRVVGTATETDNTYFRILELRPDLVLADVELPGKGIFTVAEELGIRLPETRVALLTSYLTDVFLDQVLRQGMAGYLLKTESFPRLQEHLRQLAQGKTVFSPEVADRIEFDPLQRQLQVKTQSFLRGLTNRQLEVLRHLARGESVKEVARVMVLSERAIESHKYRIMQKLGIHDRVELTRYAIREGLTLP